MSNDRKKIFLANPTFDEEMEAAALNALHNERFVLGEDVYKFEEEFARYVGAKYAVSTGSGTSALQIALLSLGVGHGQEVVTSAFSFIASANAVLHSGADPKFADIDLETYNVDPGKMEAAITARTKVLLPVHLYGYPCNLKAILGLAKDRGLMVVEDACQAHGAGYFGQKAGAIGEVGCFSFYPSKNMTVCGDGGMLVTNNEEVAVLASKIRNCGRKTQYEHDVVGYTSRLNTVNAAIGRVQLRRLDEWNRKRVRLAEEYDKMLAGIESVGLPPIGDFDVKPVYHLYVVKVKNRDDLSLWLEKEGIQCGVHYPLPIPLQPIYRQMYDFKTGQYPKSEIASKKCLSLPIHPFLSIEDIHYVCEKIREFYVAK